MAPHRLTSYAHELAGIFHVFYTNCRVLTEDEALRNARLLLIKAGRDLSAQCPPPDRRFGSGKKCKGDWVASFFSILNSPDNGEIDLTVFCLKE